MDIYEAVKSRRAVRGFKDQPVSREVLERVLSAAAWSPSGSNIQPWNIYVVTGAPLVELKHRAVERVVGGGERPGQRAAVDRLQHRCLDLDETLSVEEATRRTDDLRARDEQLA